MSDVLCLSDCTHGKGEGEGDEGEATETRLTLQHETAVVLMAEEERRRRRRSGSSSSSSSLLPRSSRSLHSTKTYSNTRKTGRHTETL